MASYSIIAAIDEDRGLGLEGKIPWDMPEDLSFFRTQTSGGVVIMGRKTWESLPAEHRPLKDRKNIVVSRTLTKLKGAKVYPSFKKALDNCKNQYSIFVIGGAEIYAEALRSPFCRQLMITEIPRKYGCDVHFPEIPSHFQQEREQEKEYHEKTSNEKIEVKVRWYTRSINGFDENQYLRGLMRILSEKNIHDDRTGVGVYSSYGMVMRYDLRKTFPLLTTKRVFWRGVVEELLFFLRGQTDTKILEEKKVNIWQKNTRQEFLDKLSLPYEEGDMGPMYGFQWRHWGAEYRGCDQSYRGQGVDQLAELIQRLKTDPYSRRHVLSAWNVSDLKKMVLNPCHVMVQFDVVEKEEIVEKEESDKGKEKAEEEEPETIKYYELSCQMIQRSADMACGVPFNIASYALLTRLIAEVCGYRPGFFYYTIGNAHIYKNHLDGINEQVQRPAMPPPKLHIRKKLQTVEDLEELTFEDFELEDYCPYPSISFEMNE